MKKYALLALAAIVLVGALGFLVVPPLLKSVLVDTLSARLHRPVAIRSVSFNPYALALTVDGLAIEEREGGAFFAGFDRLLLNLEASSLLRGGLVFSQISLNNPKIRVTRFADQRYNFSDLVDELFAQPSPSEKAMAFSLNNIELVGGAIEFDDRPAGAKHVVDAIALSLPVVSNMAQASDSLVEPAFSARVNGAPLAIKGKSRLFAESRESELLINLDALQFAKFQEYIPFQLPLKIVSGALDGDLKFVFSHDKNKPKFGISGELRVSGLAVSELSGAPLLALKRLDLVVGSVDLLQRKLTIDRIVVDSPELRARIDAEGVVDWQAIVDKVLTQAPAAPAGKAPTTGVDWSIGEAKVIGGALRWVDASRGKPLQGSVEGFSLELRKLDSKGASDAEFDVEWRVDAQDWLKVDAFAIKGGRVNLVRRELLVDEVAVRGTRMLIRRTADGRIESLRPPTLRLVEAAQTVQAEAGQPWKITVAKYRGENLGVRFEDDAVAPAAAQVVSEFNVEIDNISTEPGQTSTIATRFRLNGNGQAGFSGSVKLVPLEVDLKLDVKRVDLVPLQPYFSEKLNVDVKRGELTVAGELQLRPAAASGLLGPLAGGFKGAATVGDLSVVDKVNSADFLRWKSLYFGKLDLRLNPDALSIGEIALTDFFARAILSAEGKFNLLHMLRQDAPSPTAASPAADSASAVAAAPAAGKASALVAPPGDPALPITIGMVTLQGGSVNFTDNFIKPNYSARLRQIGGRVSGLSSAKDSVAKVELRGSYDNVAPLNVTASVNPFGAQPYLDLQAEVKGIELNTLSPYSGKYAGYAIEKGKLSLFVNYKIENRQLTAENRIFLDQLTFGEAVDSPEATKLPVTLAVALLKNRQGEIDINLPISGSLDDPEFSMGGLIFKVITNLLVKAVSSPFALLGSLFGGDSGELSTVEFDYGRATLGAEAQGRLEKLAKALVDRPGLRLEVEARVETERDREGAKRASMERKVRAQKREDLAKAGGEKSPGQVIEVSDAEYPDLLERVYRAEKFPKPRNLVGLVKTLPVEEMEKLILTNTTIDDDDLRGLGDRRARAVRDWLIAHEVPAERIFLLPSKIVEAESKSENDAKGSRGSRVDFMLK